MPVDPASPRDPTNPAGRSRKRDRAERGEACKGVILANPHCETALSERSGLPGFTDPAVSVMKGLGVVGITTTDLYRVWQDVTWGDAQIDCFVGEICDHEGGVYTYRPSGT